MTVTEADASTTRRVVHVARGLPTSDGAGVSLTRMLGHSGLPDLDPFLLLDQIRSDEAEDYIAGFPNHPHRGFETVTIMLDGRMRHGDNQGNGGVIGPGGIQWMTAGRGIVHSEIPEQEDGRLWGFQLWVNLPARLKMTPPRYQEFAAEAVPVEARDGARVRVLAGRLASGVAGPAESAAVAPLLLDVSLEPGARFDEPVARDHNALVAVYAGAVDLSDGERPVTVADPDLAVLSQGERIAFTAGAEGARALVIAGKPLREPVARHGPFVMNTQDELRQAFDDFQAGRL